MDYAKNFFVLFFTIATSVRYLKVTETINNRLESFTAGSRTTKTGPLEYLRAFGVSEKLVILERTTKSI